MIKINDSWIRGNYYTYESTSTPYVHGIEGWGPGDGKIYVSTGSILFQAISKTQAVPNEVNISNAVNSAEIALIIVPLTTISDLEPISEKNTSSTIEKCTVITSIDSSWIDVDNTKSVKKEELPTLISAGQSYVIPSPFGKTLCQCIPYLKINDTWVAVSGQYSQQYTNGATDLTGVFAATNGDGNIYLTTGSRTLIGWNTGSGALAPIVTDISDLQQAECIIAITPLGGINEKFTVITPESTSWIDLDNTESIIDTNLPNPVNIKKEYILDSPFGNSLVFCDILVKTNNKWVFLNGTPFNAQGNSVGATAFGPGDGKIYVSTGSSYILFNDSESYGFRSPTSVGLSSAITSAEIVIICRN